MTGDARRMLDTLGDAVCVVIILASAYGALVLTP